MTRPGTIRSSIDVGRCSANAWASQPVVKLRLHSGPPTRLPRWGPRSAGDASPLHPTALKNARWGPRPLTALLLPQIFPIPSSEGWAFAPFASGSASSALIAAPERPHAGTAEAAKDAKKRQYFSAAFAAFAFNCG